LKRSVHQPFFDIFFFVRIESFFRKANCMDRNKWKSEGATADEYGGWEFPIRRTEFPISLLSSIS